jgi:hypothetical protein
MRTIHKILVTLLALLLISAGAGWWYTKPISLTAQNKRDVELTSAALVDESTYATAHKLAQLAITPAEHAYAQSALRIADHQLALAFTSALRDVEAHPPALSPEALKIQDRLTKSQVLLDSDQQRVTQLEAALATAAASKKDVVRDELDLAQAQLDLDKDEVEEANQDLLAAGGNPQQRIELLEREHEAQAKTRTAAAAAAAAAAAGAAGGATTGTTVTGTDMGAPGGSCSNGRNCVRSCSSSPMRKATLSSRRKPWARSASPSRRASKIPRAGLPSSPNTRRAQNPRARPRVPHRMRSTATKMRRHCSVRPGKSPRTKRC